MCCPYHRRPDLSASAAHARFGAFIARMVGGSGDAMAGLENIPIAPLATTLGFIKDAPGAPSQATLDAALAVAYRKADEMLAEAQDTPEVLLRDEIAAVNIYTQEAPVYRSLNAALRTNERSAVKPYWGYIRLLQHALFKLPKDTSGALFRGVKVTWEPLEDLKRRLERLLPPPGGGGGAVAMGDIEPELWWGYSSTSTNLKAVQNFLVPAGVFARAPLHHTPIAFCRQHVCVCAFVW